MTADEEGRKLLLSEPKQIISLIGDDAPQYVESESEINEESINKKIVEKILEDWRGKIKPCRVDIENLTQTSIEKLKQRLLQKQPLCIPLMPTRKYDMSEVEVVSETDLEMFPEDTSSVITDSPAAHSGKVRNQHIKPADYVETSTERKMDKSDVNTSLSRSSQQVCSGENDFEEAGSSTVKEEESAFNTSTEIETRSSIPSCMNTSTEIYTADEPPELQKESTSNPVTLPENVKHQTHENVDKDDFVDASQSLFDDKTLDSDDVEKEQNITTVAEDVIEDTQGGSVSSEKNEEKPIHDGKSEDSISAIEADVGENESRKTVQETKQEESDDEDEVISLRPDSDSEPEVDVTNVWNSGEDEACVIDGALMGIEDTRCHTENSETTNNQRSPSKADDGKPESLSRQSADIGFVPKDEKGNDLLELKSSVFDEAPDSPVVDLLPDKSDSEPDEEEWIHTSKIESAVDESEMSAFDPPTEDIVECDDEKDVQKTAHDEDVKKDEPELLEQRRSLRSVNRLSLSAKKKKKSGDEKSVSPTIFEPSKRQTRSAPISVKQEDVKHKKNIMSSNITDARERTKDNKSKVTLRSKENKIDESEKMDEKLETNKRIKKENEDHFESPLSQISNGFTIETDLICDVEVNIIKECENEDDSIALSQMPILIESSDDEELTVKPESEPFFSDDEYHSLFVISSDDEDTTAEVKEERERHTSGYGSDLEIIGEEAVKLVKVKEEREDKIGEKVEDDAVKQSASNSFSSVSDDLVKKVSNETVDGKSTQIILGQLDDESSTISNRNESHTPQSPHNVDLVAVADEEVRKFLTGGMSKEIEADKIATERRSKVAEGQTFSDSSDDESFEDLEGDFLEKKELEKKMLAEAEKKRTMFEKASVQSSDSSDSEDEDLEGDFLSRIEKEMKSKRVMSSNREKEERNEKETLTSPHKDEGGKREAEGHKEIPVSPTATEMGSQDTESECHDDKDPSGDNPSDVSDDDSDNGEVTFKPGTPKMDDFEEFAKESSEETLPNIPAPKDSSEEEEFISIPSSSFYKKEKTHKYAPPYAQAHGIRPGKIVKKPVGLITAEDMRLRTQRLRGGKGRLTNTPFEVQSNQIARAKAQMKERMKNKSKGSN